MDRFKPKSVDDIIEEIGFGKVQVFYLLFLSIIEIADGMEVTILSILTPQLRCNWEITLTQGAFLVSAVFFGMMIGSIFLSNLTDIYGRRTISLLIVGMTFYYGLASAFSPNIWWLYLWRVLLGVGLGGMPLILSTYLMEFLPRTSRAKVQSLMFVAWGVGAIFTAVIGYFVVPVLGWRWLLGITILPVLLGIVPLCLMDESPRFLLLQGLTDVVKDILVKIARKNGRELTQETINLESASYSDEKGKISFLFHPSILRLTIIQCVLWLLGGLIFFGALLLSTELPLTSYPCLQNSREVFPVIGQKTDHSCCSRMTKSVLITIMVASLGDTFGAVLNFFIVDAIGRKRTMCLFASISAVVFICMDICMPVTYRRLLLLASRCSAAAFTNTLFIYTLEVYPTSIRATAVGFCGVIMRFGGLITPFIAEILVKFNVRITLFLYSGLCIAAAVFSMLLPRETKELGLAQEIASSYAGVTEMSFLIKKDADSISSK